MSTSEEEVPLSSIVRDDDQPNIYVNVEEPEHPDHDTNIEIKLTPEHHDETLNLIDTNTAESTTPNTSSDFVNITNDNVDSNPDTNHSNHSSGSKHEYVVVNVGDNTQQTKHAFNDEQEEEEDKDTMPPYTASPMNIGPILSPHLSTESIGSEPAVDNVTKAMILYTFVPKHKGTELTVLAGEFVTVLESEAITFMDNPLALMNNPSGDTKYDKIIVLNNMHWTRIQSRNGTGLVPSNILSYDENPIHNVWTKVTVEHLYNAKAPSQLSISANERLQIYGVVTDDGMILAKRNDTSAQGLIPYNFVEIPSAQTTDTAKDILRHGSVSSTDYCEEDDPDNKRNRSSLSSHDSLGNGAPTSTSDRHTIASEKRGSVMFGIDDIAIKSVQKDGTADTNDESTKHKLKRRIKKFSYSISTTIDKIHPFDIKPRGDSLDIIRPHTSNKFAAPIGVESDQVIEERNAYDFNAPLNWKRVYVLKDFDGTQTEIELVYQLYVETVGRKESILSYITDTESDAMTGDDHDPNDAAVPSRAKKTEHDVLKVTTHDMIEIAGDPSPEGWVFARLVDDKERKGFVPISYVCMVDAHSKSNTANTSDLHMQIQQHHVNTLVQHNEDQDATQTETHTDTAALDQEELNSVSPTEMNQTDYIGELSPTSTSLPLHWPFSSYPVHRRSQRSKVIESMVMSVLLFIFVLPILVEQPGSSIIYVWWVNLVLVCLPWITIFVLRMTELWWTNTVAKKHNPNNRVYARLLFYVVLLVYFIGLFVVIIATFIEREWIKDHSPVLWFATVVEIIVFMCCAVLIVSSILFILIWKFCCRISSNRWETRIEFYCCTKGGDPVATKRYPRNK
eukprot:126137_1